MPGILKRKKRLGRPRKTAKKDRPKLDSKSKRTKSRSSKSKKTKKSKVTKTEAKKSSTTTETVQPKKENTASTSKNKRKPGRPKKKSNSSDKNAEKQHTTQILEEETRPEKRGPGRPPKTTKDEEEENTKKPGRPKKSAKNQDKTDSADKETESNKNVKEDTSTEPKEEPKEEPKKSTKKQKKKSTKKSTKKSKKAGRPRKNKTKKESKPKNIEDEKPQKIKEKTKQPNPLIGIMDNFRDDNDSDEDSSSDDELKNMLSDTMGGDVMIPEDSDMGLMSHSDIDVEEIVKIDTTDSDEIFEEIDAEKSITEKQQMKEDVAEMEKKETICPECGSTKLINDHERGEVVCGACGLVIDDNIVDMGPEWRAFDHEQRDKRTRVGAPITYTIHDKGLSTMIDWRNKDIYGRDIPARNRAQWYRLRKWQRKIRISGATERNLAFALSELDRDSSRLGLPRSVRESASVVYRNAVENKLIRGRSIEGVVAASLYAACRRCKVPRTLDEIADVSRVSKKEVGRTYRFLTRELHIRLPPTSPIDYVPRFASELNLSGAVQSKAIEIINQAMDNGLTSGRGPTGVAAAALYIASVILGERKTQRDVADIAGVTEVTIRNRYKELTEQLDMGVNL